MGIDEEGTSDFPEFGKERPTRSLDLLWTSSLPTQSSSINNFISFHLVTSHHFTSRNNTKDFYYHHSLVLILGVIHALVSSQGSYYLALIT